MGLRGPNAQEIDIPDKARGKRVYRDWQEKKTLVDQIFSFVESLPCTSGEFAGTNFKLRPFQKEIIRGIYGPKKKGKRLVRQAVISVPRKNGKTGLTAVLVLAHLCGPLAEERGAIFSAAADQNQAALIYNEIVAMVRRDEELVHRIIIREHEKSLKDAVTDTTFKAISSKATSKHGFNASFIVYDELAQAPDRRLFDALATSTGARQNPLMMVISTQSHDPSHVMSELVDYGQSVMDGTFEDPAFYCYLKTAPMDADPWNEKTWFDCNPALGDFRSLDEMRAYARKAQRIPAEEAAFRLLYLNQRVGTEHRFISKNDWDVCGRGFQLDELDGKPCFAGLDLSDSGKNDLSSLVLMFPLENGSKVIVPYFWACEPSLEQAEIKDHAPYRLWAKQGHLRAVPARVLDYSFIAAEVKKITERFDLQVMAFDRHGIHKFINSCEAIGITMKLQPHDQGFKDMSPSIAALEDEILSWRLIHNNNPLMWWCMDNVKIALDANGNRRFDKRKQTGRIDGAVALAMVAGLVATQKPKTEPEYQVLFV